MISVYFCDGLRTHPEHYHVVAAHMDDLRWAAQRIVDIKDPDVQEGEPVGNPMPNPHPITRLAKAGLNG